MRSTTAGVGQDLDQIGIFTGEHLVPDVVVDEQIRARAGRIGLVQGTGRAGRQRGQLDAGRPPFGVSGRRGHLFLRHRRGETRQHLRRLRE